MQAFMRITQPHPIEGGIVAIVAGIGIVINSLTALMFMKDKEKDINTKGAYLHMVSDALISLGVVIAGIIIIYTNWFWLDSVVSLILVVVVIFGTWGLLKESLRLTLNGVPKDIDINEVKKYLLSLKGVSDVHDLHIWGLSTTETAMTAHLVYASEQADRRPHELSAELRRRFGIGHATVQIESDADAALCRLRPNDVV